MDNSSASPGLPTEKRFFLQLLQSQLHAFAAMPKGTVSARTLLSAVSSGWEAAESVSKEIRLLNMAGFTSVSILGDEKLSTQSVILLPGKSRVDIKFTLHSAIDSEGRINTRSNVTARALYGPVAEMLVGAKGHKVHQALAKEIESKDLGNGALLGAVKGFEQWVAVQLRKKTEGKQKEPEKDRSPLSPRKAPNVQKKHVPVPVVQQKAHMAVLSAPPPSISTQERKQKERPAPTVAQEDKENLPEIHVESSEWTPMTPIKRVGGLRRSPIAG
jgi:hypothetical protein